MPATSSPAPVAGRLLMAMGLLDCSDSTKPGPTREPAVGHHRPVQWSEVEGAGRAQGRAQPGRRRPWWTRPTR